MFKVSKTLVIVESVEKAVKFYTEKLGFALSETTLQKEGGCYMSSAEVKKGNAILVLRAPVIEELAEFGMVKRCVGRSAGMQIEINKAIDKFYKRCKKKNVPIVSELAPNQQGQSSFSVRDPFGLKLTFVEHKTGDIVVDPNLFVPCGVVISKERILGISLKDKAAMEPMVEGLRSLGILRRVAYRFVRGWVKSIQAKEKRKK